MFDALQSLAGWTPLGLPALLFVITVVVFFHELGHFLVARAFGVKVEVFSVGFGKEIFGITDRRGTRWRVSWLPIGGYVKFAGDANAASAPDTKAAARMTADERSHTLFHKPVGQRALVAAAGPFANFLLAIVLLTGLFLYAGHVTYPPVVGTVAKDSPAAAAGIRPGDRITAIDNAKIEDFGELPQIISVSGGENLAISLERAGTALTVHVVPHLVRQKDQFSDMASTFVIGVTPKPGLKPVVEHYSPIGAFGAACRETGDIIVTSLRGIMKMVIGHASTDQVRGMIGMGQVAKKVAEIGFLPLLSLVAILSVSIGLINLFPIPLLDGGHLLYYGCEAVLGRPLGERAQELGFRFGVILVVGLVLVSALHDLARLNLSETQAVPRQAAAKNGFAGTGMRTIALKSRLLRATSAVLAAMLAAAPAEAQLRAGAAERAKELNAEQANPNAVANPAAAAAAPVAPVAAPRPIQHIVVTGYARVEPGTVLTYVNIREGDNYDPATADAALKALYATGLFSDVNYKFADGTLTIRVTENPIVNQVVFEGNSKVSDKDLTKEVQIKPRAVFTRAKIQADVQRIIELYRRNGKFAAKVDPQIIQRPQNRVDLIFSISDGPTTGVSAIRFIGNKVYDSDTLRGQIATEESRWWKFLASNDNYDPDRLQFDREQLRRYYSNHGYADFRVVSAVAELTPDRKDFYITFTVDEGAKYKFGKVTIESKIRELPPAQVRPLVNITPGELYAQEKVQKSIDTLTNAAGTKGYAFAEVHPRIQRDRDTHTINMSFEIVQGPRVYIEKIDIAGNTRTLDKVIRREFRLVEGDAFNRVLLDRSRTRIRGLGFFKDVDIKNNPGSQPDRTNITVNVTEQSTGSLSLGLGYSSTSQLVGEFSYTEINMFGRGQNLRASVQVSQIQKQYQLSFTEPWFLDRPLAAGFDLYKVQTDYEQATYESDITAGVLRIGFPISEFSTVGFNYTYKLEQVLPFSNAPPEVLRAAGKSKGSIISFSYGYSNLDDYRKPTRGVTFSLSQGFAGFGGTLKFLKTDMSFSTYMPMFGESVIGSLSGRAGVITGYDGSLVPFEERYFDGGDSFRGFALAGVGPRDINAPLNTGAVGGTVHAIGTFAVRMPQLLPESYGVNAGLFTDFGTLGRIDSKPPDNCINSSCIKDNLAFRASAGISVQWKSPFGPVQIDLGLPFVKTKYDRPQIIHFTSGTGF